MSLQSIESVPYGEVSDVERKGTDSRQCDIHADDFWTANLPYSVLAVHINWPDSCGGVASAYAVIAKSPTFGSHYTLVCSGCVFCAPQGTIPAMWCARNIFIWRSSVRFNFVAIRDPPRVSKWSLRYISFFVTRAHRAQENTDVIRAKAKITTTETMLEKRNRFSFIIQTNN